MYSKSKTIKSYPLWEGNNIPSPIPLQKGPTLFLVAAFLNNESY